MNLTVLSLRNANYTFRIPSIYNTIGKHDTLSFPKLLKRTEISIVYLQTRRNHFPVTIVSRNKITAIIISAICPPGCFSSHRHHMSVVTCRRRPFFRLVSNHFLTTVTWTHSPRTNSNIDLISSRYSHSRSIAMVRVPIRENIRDIIMMYTHFFHRSPMAEFHTFR